MSKATTAERALNRKGGTMSRLIKTLFGFYPVLLPLVVVGVVLCAIINSIGATFLQSALQIISESWQSGDWEAAQPKIAQLVTTLACIYGVGILSSLFWNRAMAIVTQGSLEKLREKMVRCELDTRNEKIGYKIREARQVDRVPYMLIIGDKEAESGTVSVRRRGEGDLGAVKTEAFLATALAEITAKQMN